MRLMQSLRLGDLELGNRVVMAPMTRNRAHADGVASDEMVAYYAQRASAGLIVTEAGTTGKIGPDHIDPRRAHQPCAQYRAVSQSVTALSKRCAS